LAKARENYAKLLESFRELEAGMSRNDYLEALAVGNPPIMETVKTKPELDDSVRAALIDAESAKKTAAIFGFTPDEALADAHFQINMLTSNYDELEDRHEALKREYSVVFPIMETVEATANPIMETVEADIELHKQQLEASDLIIRSKNQEIAALNARLAGKDEIISEATEQIERLESDMSYVLLKVSEDKKSATTGKDLSEIEPANLLNQLKGKRKKSTASLADVEAILELIEGNKLIE